MDKQDSVAAYRDFQRHSRMTTNIEPVSPLFVQFALRLFWLQWPLKDYKLETASPSRRSTHLVS